MNIKWSFNEKLLLKQFKLFLKGHLVIDEEVRDNSPTPNDNRRVDPTGLHIGR